MKQIFWGGSNVIDYQFGNYMQMDYKYEVDISKTGIYLNTEWSWVI